MVKVIRKPVELNAVQWTGDNRDEVIEFVGSVGRHYCCVTHVGNWLIKDENGFVSAWTPDVFVEKFQPVGMEGLTRKNPDR